MNIVIASIGKFGNSPHQKVYELYLKRLPWKIDLKELEIKAKISGDLLKEKEGQLLMQAVRSCQQFIVLDEKGQNLDSREFALLLNQTKSTSINNLGFIIGGADGVADSVKKSAKHVISLGKMTFPHLMVRSILLEQIYRAYSIINNHPYHRE